MIYYLADFPADAISGGIRMLYRHVEALNRLGIDAIALSPDGHPGWFTSNARVATDIPTRVSKADYAVFGEAFMPEATVVAALLDLPLRKQIFCQNHYYIFEGAHACSRPQDYGVEAIFACSNEAAHFLKSAFGYASVPVIPCVVDPRLFFPERKTLSIACMPRKRAFFMNYVRQLFKHRHPDLAHVEWIEIDGVPEAEAAASLRRAAVFLALGTLEGLGLPPLEAMAAGCLVCGLHGGGGRDYASATNGIWCELESPLHCVDALAALLRGVRDEAPFVAEMRRQGALTAARYSEDRMAAALLSHFADAR